MGLSGCGNIAAAGLEYDRIGFLIWPYEEY